jgi:two-component system, OmpR family, phosphate regulon sensor histidine kinase PhoR
MPEPTLDPLEIYEFVFRSVGDGVMIASPADLRITHMNPAAAAMLQVTPENILDATSREKFKKHPNLINLFERKGDQTLDVRLPRRRIAIGIASTMEAGERVIILQDVTEKRDLETRREMLIKSIAHDLRNPIAAVGGFADLVGKFGDVNEQQKKFLTRIKQTTTKLHDMSELLVELAWIEAGMPLMHIPIRLSDAINKAILAVEVLAQSHQIGLAVSLQNPLPVVMGDPNRLHMVIYHLLHNAILYSVAEDNIVIHAWGDENEVYCSVADQGIGVNDDEFELIFDRMYRSRDPRVREISGGGIGLTLARTIVRRMGGDLWATSNLDEGSTFTFVLPTEEI